MRDHGPAMTVRRHDKGYPYGNRVPRSIRMLRRVTPDFPFLLDDPQAADGGLVYPAWTNSYGAVAAILPNGRTLGVIPGEFDVVDWFDFDAAEADTIERMHHA